MVELADGVPVFVQTKKENDYKATIEELESHVTSKTKVLLINSPSNPTGVVLSLDELQAYADFAKKHDLVVVSDEMYEYLIYDEDIKHISIATLDGMRERTVVINGVSKSYAMTGWRIGYCACPKDLAKAMTNIQSHMTSNPCSIAQYGALAGLTQKSEEFEMMKKAFTERRDYIYNNVKDIKHLSCIYPQGAFYLYVDVSGTFGKTVNGRTIQNANDVGEILIEQFDVCVIPCTDFGSTNHIRLSYATSLEKIVEGVKRIENFANAIV